MGRRLRIVTLALPVGLVVAACGGGASDSTELPPAPAAESATPAAPATVEPAGNDPVLASYLRFWDAVVAANRTADPSLAALQSTAADPELSKVRATISRNKVQELSLRGTVGHSPQPAKVSGDTATIEDCYDIARWNPVRLDTGQPVDAADESGTGRYRARFTLRRTGSGWLVVDHVALGGC